MSKDNVPQKNVFSDENIDLDILFEDDPAPTPTPVPDTEDKAAWAEWYHRVGYWVAEMDGDDSKRRSDVFTRYEWDAEKHCRVMTNRDDGVRRTLAAIKMAWQDRSDSNISLKMGWMRDTTPIVCIDADGATAKKYAEKLMPSDVPRCSHPSGEGVKYFVRMKPGTDISSARLLVPGCTNSGHDGLELLGAGKTATVPPSVHQDGDAYVWDVPLPDDPAKVPLIPAEILALERVKPKIGKSDLGEDVLIRQSGTNREMTVADWRQWMIDNNTDKVSSVHSPFRTDVKPSCWLTLYHGSLWLHDAATGESMKDGLYSEHSGSTSKKPDIRTDRITAPFGKHIKIRRQYIKDGSKSPFYDPVLKDARMMAIRSAVGTGKTTAIADYIQLLSEVFKRELNILVLSHRRSLVGHSVKAFHLRTDYRNIKTWGDVSHNDLSSLGICLDSITGYAGRGKLASRLSEVNINEDGIPEIINMHWDIVILAEAESVFRHLHGGTVGDNSYNVWMTLGNVMRTRADLTILADAHLSDYSIKEYRTLVGGDPGRDVLIENTWKRGQASYTMTGIPTGAKPGEGVPLFTSRVVKTAPRLVKFPTPEDLEHQLIRAVDAGKSLYVAVTRLAEAKRLRRKLRRKFPEKHIVTVTGNHDDEEGEAFLADPDAYMTTRKVDVLLCTQAIESGVSIDVDAPAAFDMAVLFGYGDSSTWQDLVQMVGRPRHLNSRWVFAWVTDRGRAPWLSESNYRQTLIDAREATYTLFREHLDDTGKIVRQPADDDHLMSHVRTVVHECRSRVNLAPDFWAYWESQCCEVRNATAIENGVMDDAERKKLKKEKTSDKQAIKVADAKAIAGADTRGMTLKQAVWVLDSDCKPQEKRRAHKVLIEDFYAQDATPGLVMEDDEGKLRRKVRRFNAVRIVATQGADGIRKVLVAKDDRSVADGVTALM